MSLADRLRLSREKADLTQTEVAKLTNINHKTISNWENGVSKPDPLTVSQLADVYDVSLDYLFGKTDDITFSTKALRKAPTPASDFLKMVFADDPEMISMLEKAAIGSDTMPYGAEVPANIKAILRNALLLAAEEVKKIKAEG